MNDQRISEFVQAYKEDIRIAKNEAEVRSRFDTAARTKLNIKDLKLEQSRHDIRRNRVIIEFKDKNLFHGSKKSQKFKEALTQLTEEYMPKQAKVDNRDISDYIGVCFDVIHFCFVFMEDYGKFRSTDLVNFNENSAGILIQALDRDDRIELVPQNIVDDFGSGSVIASMLLSALWKHLQNCLAWRKISYVLKCSIRNGSTYLLRPPILEALGKLNLTLILHLSVYLKVLILPKLCLYCTHIMHYSLNY
jgi:hypothetical protein